MADLFRYILYIYPCALPHTRRTAYYETSNRGGIGKEGKRAAGRPIRMLFLGVQCKGSREDSRQRYPCSFMYEEIMHVKRRVGERIHGHYEIKPIQVKLYIYMHEGVQTL